MNKKLYKSRHNKTLAGVCGGLAEYFDIDVTIVRLIWIAFFFLSAGFPVFMAYLIAALIMPEEPMDRSNYNDQYSNVNYRVEKDEE
ncbi:PspC domain-containing protein [Lutispora thermophila]|uniref:Phage shock protein C (PspC) family protein n=1 Tax=Lutispora thermophila DSM 19022 TaxID=1122184 RepID=A0A1M6I8N7_9FIRM|nr:PspC domain-containing protein [Lutispora thermophila]SHJ30830.1 phage shock protein C (PspC) family protein [Lutispora thermophila DSM 19022]